MGRTMSAVPEFVKVVVFGVGLSGGSLALGLKAAEQVEEVVGFGRSLATLTQALDLGIIDRVGANPCQEVADADLVLIATPVGQMPEIMARIAPYLGAQTLVTDGGSTKEDVVAAMRACFGDKAGQFVPAMAAALLHTCRSGDIIGVAEFHRVFMPLLLVNALLSLVVTAYLIRLFQASSA